jgi:hypothetical protein
MRLSFGAARFGFSGQAIHHETSVVWSKAENGPVRFCAASALPCMAGSLSSTAMTRPKPGAEPSRWLASSQAVEPTA